MLLKKAKLKKLTNKNKKINPYICIAGKNQCSIDWYPIIWSYLESIFDKVKFEK